MPRSPSPSAKTTENEPLVQAREPSRAALPWSGPGAGPEGGPGALVEVERLARGIGGLQAHHPELAARAARLVDRLASQEFHIAFVGEFKRGKSTLVNALIGRPLLPTGVVPLTTVATEVHVGSPDTIVVFDDGRRLAISTDQIGDYATEIGNPSNVLGVSRLEVGVETTFGVPGLVLVDTPGVASVNDQNTAAAHDVLLDSDGAVVVLSADSPLSESEHRLLTELGRRRSKVFVVINKCDHLSSSEVEEVRAFVTPHLLRLLGKGVEPYCVAARPASDTTFPAGADVAAAEAFTVFKDALDLFVRNDLAAARHASAVGELRRLGAGLAESIQIEAATATLDLETLGTRVHRFEMAAEAGRRLFDEDCLLLEHEVSELALEVGRMLAEDAARAAGDRRSLLVASAASVSFRQLDAVLREAIEVSVREGFEPVRRAAQQDVEEAWVLLADRFGSRLQAHVDGLRTAANEVFDVHLPVVSVPAVSEQKDRFSFLFLHLEGPSALVGRFLRGLLPTSRARQRMVRLAQRRLAEEFDKHAGRARYDITERLSGARRQFVETMAGEFEQTSASILAAVSHARSNLDMTVDEQQRQHRLRNEAMAIAEEVACVAVPQVAARD